ncbi:2-dehydropantoate 2-reductase [Pontibacillus litoralis]|nr:2-dehydropantoate 2-reductase [Pontibacillus litoralis]
MNIGIIGGGAVGMLCAWYFGKQGHNITMYVRREEQCKELRQHGMQMREEQTRLYPTVHRSTNLKPEEVYVICTKQHAIEQIVHQLSQTPFISPLLFLQNGMEHVNHFSKLKNPIIVGVVEHGAMKHSDTLIGHTGRGIIRISPVTSDVHSAKEIKDALHYVEFPVRLEENWYDMLARKLVINAVINPITALFQVKNGGILQNEHLNSLAYLLCEEACSVVSLPVNVMWEEVQHIAKQTEANESSMMKDIKEGNKTEIEAISGYLLKHSSESIPYTTCMYKSVRAIEGIRKGEVNE